MSVDARFEKSTPQQQALMFKIIQAVGKKQVSHDSAMRVAEIYTGKRQLSGHTVEQYQFMIAALRLDEPAERSESA